MKFYENNYVKTLLKPCENPVKIAQNFTWFSDKLHIGFTGLVTVLIEGELDQLLAGGESWPDGAPNWSEKTRMYNIKTKDSDATPANGGQQAFLKSKEVYISRFEHQLCKSIKTKVSQVILVCSKGVNSN